MATAIGTLGTIPTLSVGGVVFTDLTNLIVLTAHVVTATRFTTLRAPAASGGYAVTTGKTLTIRAVKQVKPVQSSGSSIALLYGDTDVGLDSSSAPTTPKYSGNDPAFKDIYASTAASGAGVILSESAPFFQVPALKYPCVTSDSANVSTIAYGYEA